MAQTAAVANLICLSENGFLTGIGLCAVLGVEEVQQVAAAEFERF